MELLKRVLTAIVLIPTVLILVLRAPAPLLALVTAVVALLAIHELLKLAEAYGFHPFRWPTYIFVGLFFLVIAIPSATPLLSTSGFTYIALSAAVLAPFIFLSIGMRRADLASAFPSAMVSSFSFAYIALPLACLVQLREQWQGSFYLLYLLLVVWAGDVFAYFIGKSIGRHRMSPRVSPKKTWEGAVASVIASVAVGLLMFHYSLSISTALLHAHLIDLRDGIFNNQQPSLIPIIALSPPRPRRNVRPHRRPPLRRPCPLVLHRLARHDAIGFFWQDAERTRISCKSGRARVPLVPSDAVL